MRDEEERLFPIMKGYYIVYNWGFQLYPVEEAKLFELLKPCGRNYTPRDQSWRHPC